MLSSITKRPLVIFAFVFCLGIFVSRQIEITFLLICAFALIFLLLVLLFFKKGLRFDIFLLFLIFSLGAALLKNSQILPRCHISRFVSYKNNFPCTVKGYIETEPLLKNNRTSFIFRSQEMQCGNLNYNSCGNILVHLKGKKDLNYGDELLLKGNLYRPFNFSSRTKQGYRDYLYNQGIFSVMNVKANSAVRLNKNKGLTCKRVAFWLKEKMEAIIFAHVSSVAASILDAMILGEKRNIPPLVNNSMVKSGTVHILVVSGFNVGLIAFVIILFLKLLRLPKVMRFYIATPLLIIYCLLTGASTPVVRATVMAIVFMFAYLIKREPDIYNSCALAALFILGVNPGQLFDIGFQLSFASVVSIVCLYPKMKSLLCVGALKNKSIRFLIEGCLISLSAWLGTLGLIAYYFRIISPVTVLANIFIVPLASLITLCGFSLIIMKFISPPLVPLFVHSSEFIVYLLLKLNSLLIKIPCAYFYLS